MIADPTDIFGSSFQSLFYWKGGAKPRALNHLSPPQVCFNPCFTGRGGLNRLRSLRLRSRKIVSILVLLEGGG